MIKLSSWLLSYPVDVDRYLRRVLNRQFNFAVNDDTWVEFTSLKEVAYRWRPPQKPDFEERVVHLTAYRWAGAYVTYGYAPEINVLYVYKSEA